MQHPWRRCVRRDGLHHRAFRRLDDRGTARPDRHPLRDLVRSAQFLFQPVDGLVHRGDDAQRSGDRLPEGGLDLRRLPQRRCLQLGEDLFDEAWIIAPVATSEKTLETSAGELATRRRGVRSGENGQCGAVLQVRKSLQRLG